MADVVTSAYTIIFIGVLLLIGVLVFGTVADTTSDQFYAYETIIAANACSNESDASAVSSALNVSGCTGSIDNPPIENGTRAAPVVYNCSSTAGTCAQITVTTDYNFTVSAGLFHILDDKYNGTIKVSYWEDVWSDSVDNAQQSITGTVYGGFDLATVLVIVMAAVAIISAVLLIGRRGA